jgi:hypothetical protein
VIKISPFAGNIASVFQGIEELLQDPSMIEPTKILFVVNTSLDNAKILGLLEVENL